MRGAKAPEYASYSYFFWVRTLGAQVRTQGSHLVLLAFGVRTQGTQVRTQGTQVRTQCTQVRTSGTQVRTPSRWVRAHL